jgi:thioredoxin 1
MEFHTVRRIFYTALVLLAALSLISCGNRKSASQAGSKAGNEATAKVTFLELGSVSCIPCKKMQPIMKSIEARYVGQVKVVFHDVMKDRSVSQQYGIKLIPTQIFLDQSGKEITRHEGFFPEEDIDKILKAQGLAPTY